MKFDDLRKNWEQFAKTDPLFFIASHPGKDSGRWEPEEFFATGRIEVDDMMSHVIEVGDCGRAKALDFGCGFGRISRALAEHFDSVTGVDVAAPMIEGAREHNRDQPKCEFVLNTGQDLSLFADGSFDLVFTVAVLQHMEPQYSLGYMTEFVRVAKPGGIVAFQVPDPLKYQQLKLSLPDPVVAFGRRLRRPRGPLMEMYGLSRDQVEAAVRNRGGQIVSATEKNSSPTHPGMLYVCRKEPA